MQIRYHIDPTTGQPHIYEHEVSEQEVEDILSRLLDSLVNGSRIAAAVTKSRVSYESQ